MLDVTAEGGVSHVLTNLGEALAARDLDRALALFQDDCYWRDLVASPGTSRRWKAASSAAMLKSQLDTVKPSTWTVDNAAAFGGERRDEAWITFETGVARGTASSA